MRSKGVLASVLLGASLILLFVAERIAAEGSTGQQVVRWLGVLGVAGAVAWRGFLLGQVRGAARQVEVRLLAGYGGVLGALVLYALSTEWGLELLGLQRKAAERAGGALEALWPAVFVVSVAGLVFMELAYRKMPVAEAVELRRVRHAAQGGLSLALSLVFLFSINFVADERDVKEDLSYFKTTKPSDSTKEMVDALGKPVEAVLFYPKVNEVLDQLTPYFEELDRGSEMFSYRVRDHALTPELARKHRIRENGTVALLQGEGEEQQAETFEVGTELDSARSRLRSLDGKFQKAFSKLTQQQRKLYLTAGHQELTDPARESGATKQAQTSKLMDALSRSNIETAELGVAQGLANRVPEDAPAVAIVGAREEFLPEETESLLRYVENGGRLIVMVDPGVEHGLDPLLKGLGVQFEPGKVASNQNYVRRTASPADHGTVYTNNFSAHPSVTMASRNATRVATVFLDGASLKRYQGDETLQKAKVSFPITTGKQYWRDLDGNWERGDEEPLEKMKMMAAVSIPRDEGDEGRAVIVGDGDFVTNRVIRNAGNALVFGDILRWLIGKEQIVGDTSSEEDVKIEHTRDEDKVWFFATSFGVPLPLLGVGVWMAMRRRRRRETHRKEPDETSGSGGSAGPGEAAGGDTEAKR
jgi:hypothetical protein